MEYIEILVLLFGLAIYIFVGDLKLNKWMYLIPVATSFALWLSLGSRMDTVTLVFIMSYFSVVMSSIFDLKYREVDPMIYHSIIIAIILLLFEPDGRENMLTHILSGIVTYFFMWLYCKFGEKFGESIGGADVKVILLLSFLYPFDLVFMFLFSVFAVTIVLTVIYKIIKKDKSVPMLCSIAFAHIVFSYVYILMPITT